MTKDAEQELTRTGWDAAAGSHADAVNSMRNTVVGAPRDGRHGKNTLPQEAEQPVLADAHVICVEVDEVRTNSSAPLAVETIKRKVLKIAIKIIDQPGPGGDLWLASWTEARVVESAV